MNCETCREALSARLDGETEPVPAEETDQHLASCASCRSWQQRVSRTARMLKVRQAAPVPDLSAAILERAVPPQSGRGWWARIALIVVSAAQVALALSQMLGAGTGHGGVPAGGHVLNESVAWNLALGIALLWAAFRARVTSGLIPLLGAFVVLLAAYSTHDLLTSTVSGSRVLQHGLLVLALGLLIVINRFYSDPHPTHGDTQDTGADDLTASTTEPPAPADASDRGSRRGPLRPTGRHQAA